MAFYVYILKSNRDRHYIGYTSNLQERIYKHNSKHRGFTGTTETWILLISHEVSTKEIAIQLERKLKRFKNFRKAIGYLVKLRNAVG